MLLSVMQEQQVDTVDAYPLERVLHAAQHTVPREVLHATVRGGHREALVHPARRVLRDQQPADLRRQRHLFARLAAQRTTEAAQVLGRRPSGFADFVREAAAYGAWGPVRPD